MKKTLKTRLLAPLVEPYARYLHANILHSIRLGFAVVLSLLISRWTKMPHAEWSTITVFIILGLLQYQGAIYTKAKERILGTILGILVGLFLLWLSQGLLGFSVTSWIYYLLVGLISAVIGYYSIKQLGYIGMLTGITMSMIIASNDSVGPDGIARAINVLIGTAISVLVTIILPLKSTLMWRFLLAQNLEACAKMYDDVEAHISNPDLENHLYKSVETSTDDTHHTKKSIDEDLTSLSLSQDMQGQVLKAPHIKLDLGATTVTAFDSQVNQSQEHYLTTTATYVDKEMVAQFKAINRRLLRVRSHIAATANEAGIDTQKLDMIQRTHRNIIGTIDLLLTAAPKLAQSPIDNENWILFKHYHRQLTQAMRHIAAVLRSPSDEVFRPITRIQVSDYHSVHNLGFEWQGYFWLTQTLQGQLQSMSDLLYESKDQWYKGSGIRYQRKEQKRIHAHGGESNLDL